MSLSTSAPSPIPATSAPLLQAEGVTVRFDACERPFDVVRDVSFTLHPGRTLCLVGESGCGIRFHEQALKEWKKLGATLQEQFKKKLAERLEQPRIPSAALSGMSDCYKIKLKAAGYRLVYRVEDDIVYVTVIAVGKRERNIVYGTAHSRM